MDSRKKATAVVFILIAFSIASAAYTNTQYLAKRLTNTPPTIDGTIADSEWAGAIIYNANSFIMYPPEPSNPKGFFEFRFLYDDQYLYVAARVNDKVYTPRPGFLTDAHDYLVLAFNQGTGGGTKDGVRDTWDFARSAESSQSLIKGGYFKSGKLQWFGAGDLGSGAIQYHANQYDIEYRIKLDSSSTPSADGTFMKINPMTDQLGLTFSWHNNDGQCIPDGFGGCGRTDEVDVGEYHTLSYNYSSYEGNNEVSTKHHPVFTKNIIPWQTLTFEKNIRFNESKYPHTLNQTTHLYSAHLKDTMEESNAPIVLTRGGYVLEIQPKNIELKGSVNSQIIMKNKPMAVSGSGVFADYAGQYGSGVDIRYVYGKYTFTEILSVDAKAKIPAIAGLNKVVLVSEVRAYDNNTGEVFRIDGMRIKNKDNQTVWRMEEPQIWDSNESRNATLLNYTITGTQNITIAVEIPYAYLQTAQYPIYIDPDWTVDANTTYNLSGTDTLNWMGVSKHTVSIAYDSIHDLVYLGGGGTAHFGVYNRTSNVTNNLGQTDTGNWIGTNGIRTIAYDSNNDLVYIIGDAGVFGVYNRTSNITQDLRGSDDLNWIGTNIFLGLAYDSNNDLVYVNGDKGGFGVYNRTANKTYNLSGTDPGNWFGATPLWALAYDSNNDLVYIIGDAGVFGVYNRTSNITQDLRGSDDLNWMGANYVYTVAYDSINDLAYMGGNSGRFGVYNRTSNVSRNLSGTDPGNWIGTSTPEKIAYDSVHDLVYLVGTAGVFGVYNRTSNLTQDLRGSDTDNWIGANDLYALAYDSINDLAYLGGNYGRFGVYNRQIDAPPTVDLISPAHLTNQSSTEITFQCNASDDESIYNITLYTNISGTFAANITNTTGLRNLTAWIHKETVANGNYNWNCLADDGSVNPRFAASNRTITVDGTAPTVTLSAPVTTANLSYGTNIAFNYTPTDSNLRNCSLWVNNSGTFVLNKTSLSPSTGAYNYFYVNTTNGSFRWNVECFDTAGSSAFASSNFTLTVDTVLPTVSLSAPINLANLTNGTNTEFNYTPTDSNLRNCSLWINSSGTFALNKTSSSPTSGSYNYFYLNLTRSNFKWNIVCFDTVGNSAFASANFTLTVDATPVITYLSTIPNTNPSFCSNRSIQMIFTATDADGMGDLNNATALARFSKTGETSRFNLSCTPLTNSSTSINYTCIIQMWYWDAPGTWTINASVNDSADREGSSSSTFSYGGLIAMDLAPNNLTFGNNLIGGQNNLNATNDPLNVSNCGNNVLTSTGLTASDLLGSGVIHAENFSVNQNDTPTGATALKNETGVNLLWANISRGNGTKVNMYFYVNVPYGVPSGVYNQKTNWVMVVSD